MKKVIASKIKPQLRLDGYYNVLNKYGTQHDSTEYYQWATGAAVTDAELADLYAGNGLFSTIIDAPADDATKNGIDLGIKDKDLQKRLDDHLQTMWAFNPCRWLVLRTFWTMPAQCCLL